MTQNPEVSSFGDLLRFFRGQTVDKYFGKPLSQEKLASKISEKIGFNITRNTESNWESGKSYLHPQKDRSLLIAIVSILHKCQGIDTLEEANRLLEAGDYRALDEKEIASIDPEWETSKPVRMTGVSAYNGCLPRSTTLNNLDGMSPITLNIETKEPLPILVNKSDTRPRNAPASPLSVSGIVNPGNSKERTVIRIADKTSVTIQILIAINM